MLKYAILSVSLITVMAGAMIAPAIASIAAAFPNASSFQISLLTSLHAGLVVPFSFISGYLVRYIPKKDILIVSLILYLIGGIGGSLSDSMLFMLATRVVLGISIGLMIPLSITLISDYYEGEERTRTLGLQSAATNMGGIIAIVVSGFLAAQGWRYSFLAYGLAILALVLVFFFLPRKAPAKSAEGEAEESNFDARVFLLAIYMILTFVVFFGIPSNMSLFLSEIDITNTVVNGIIIAICSVGGFAGGMSVAFFRRVLKSFFVPLQVVYMAVGFVLIAFLNQYIVLLGLGVLILGFGYGSTVPVIFDGATKITTGAARSMATAILVSSIYLGQFLSPIVLDEISQVFGNGSVYYSYSAMALALVFVAILMFVERGLHFSGLKKWLARSSSKHALSEISASNARLQERVDTLANQLDEVRRQQYSDSREQISLLRNMQETISQRNESDNKGSY
ncbi:MFS transporter [Chromohalobacter nigrandesensis]|uniref:MFS transporter n=1 Tax=Chromohalobacter nigrandesensis TaxID=119863 RepID=UPI0031BB14DE